MDWTHSIATEIETGETVIEEEENEEEEEENEELCK